MRERLGRQSAATGHSLVVALRAERAGRGGSGAAYAMPRLPADSAGIPDLVDRLVQETG